jgi:hypothetical protein
MPDVVDPVSLSILLTHYSARYPPWRPDVAAKIRDATEAKRA